MEVPDHGGNTRVLREIDHLRDATFRCGRCRAGQTAQRRWPLALDCVRCCASGIGEKRLLRAAGERGRERGQDTRVRLARRLDGCCPPDWGKWFKAPCLSKEQLSPGFRDVSRQDENAEGQCIEKAYERAQKARCLISLRCDQRPDGSARTKN